jgi:FAD/FMN-containing dehydrogenase
MRSIDRRQFLVGTAGAGVLLRLPAEPARLSARELRELRAAVRGRVVVPRDSARLVYNTRFEGRRPDAVVHVESTADVAAAVRWANRFDVRLVARSGGHSYAGYSSTGDGVVLDLSRLRGMRVSGGRATVGPGAQLIDVQRALTRRGLTVPAGSCPTVGIGGLALGGGHGLAGRRFGLTSDNLLAARIVTADGRVRRVDRRTNEDLYWACRGGGGGNFGIVTSLTLQAHRARGAAYFFVSWPWSQAGEAIAAWQRFAPEAPPALTSILSLGTSGGAGSPRVAALGQYFGDVGALRRLVRPLTRVAGASLSTGSSSYFTMVLRWAGCLDGGLAACHRSTRSAFFARSDYFDRRVGPAGRAKMIDWIERRQRTPSLGSGALLLDAYGGALNRPAADATAFVHRDMLFSLQYLAYVGGGTAAARGSRRWIDGTWRALRPHASGEAYQNYIDPDLDGWQRAYYGDNLERLREIKKQVDPDFRFRFPQAIPPAR